MTASIGYGLAVQGREAVEHAQRTFEKAGLVLPVVPEDLVPRFKLRGDWDWATHMRISAPYRSSGFHLAALLGLLPAEFQKTFRIPESDYLVIGHGGHGVNSYALSYYLVRGPLALFIDAMWGGAYTNNELRAQEWNAIGADIRTIVNACEGPSERPPRIIVCAEDGTENNWWSPSGIEGRRTPVGIKYPSARDILTDVLSYLSGR
jgi:hypothetical protein